MIVTYDCNSFMLQAAGAYFLMSF